MADSASDCNVAGNQLPPFDSHEPLRWPDGDPVDNVISAALDRLDERRRRVRGAGGRWAFANGGNLVTGERSEPFWASLEPARQEIVDRVKVQLALDDVGAPETLLQLTSAYAEAVLIRRSEFLQLTRLTGAPTTAKQQRQLHDRRRRHLAAWATAFDRELKASVILGFTRRTKQYASMSEAVEAHCHEASAACWAAEAEAAAAAKAKSEQDRHAGVTADGPATDGIRDVTPRAATK
jgi:hypothetical protein